MQVAGVIESFLTQSDLSFDFITPIKNLKVFENGDPAKLATRLFAASNTQVYKLYFLNKNI